MGAGAFASCRTVRDAPTNTVNIAVVQNLECSIIFAAINGVIASVGLF